jgi:hypothetical protein
MDMIKDGRYHKLLGLPAGAAALWAGKLNLRWGHHAQKEADIDRYGKVEQFDSGEFEASDIVEVTMEAGQPVQGVARYPYSDNLDLVMVLGKPEADVAFVKTVWFNQASDNHKSLDRSKYNRL